MPELIVPEPEIIPPLKPLLTVSACPHPFEQHRIDYIVPAGATIAEIIELIQPDPILREHDVVYIGEQMISRDRWRVVRPKHGYMISIRLLPSGGGGWRIAAMIGIAVLAIAAMVFAPYLAPVLVTGATTTGALGVALGAGAAMIVSVGGTLLLNTFLPPPVTYAFFLLFAAVKGSGLYLLIAVEGLVLAEALPRIWDDETAALFAAVVSFWFGARSLAKAKQGH